MPLFFGSMQSKGINAQKKIPICRDF